MAKRIQIDRGAAIYKQGRCWYLDYSRNGLRSRKALHTNQRDIALELARQIVRESTENSWGIPIPKDVPFDEFLEIYRQYISTNNAPRTVELNMANLLRFRGFVHDRTGLKKAFLLSHITPRLIEEYKSFRLKRKISTSTINRELGTLSIFFNHARRLSYVQRTPLKEVHKLPIVRNRIPDTLDRDEIHRLLNEASLPIPLVGRGSKGKGNIRERITPLQDMILFALNTGARLGELLYMEWKDIDLDRKLISFRCKPEHRLKDSEDRQVRANDEVLEMLRRRRLQAGSCRWVFPSSTGEVIDRRNALRELKIVARRAGVPNANFQVLRKTFATLCATSGMPAFALKTLMGHASVRTTERYYIGNAGGQCWVPPTMGSIG